MLSGDRVILRALEESDRQAYYAWINDRALVHCSAAYRPISEANHNEWFDGITKRQGLVVFSIVVRDTDRLIGSCSLRNIDTLHRNAELQIRIGDADNRGKGYGAEAVRLLLCHAFQDLNLERVYLHVIEHNERAFKAYRKVGFIEEGTLRSAAYINGAYVNLKVMSVLRGAFQDAARG